MQIKPSKAPLNYVHNISNDPYISNTGQFMIQWSKVTPSIKQRISFWVFLNSVALRSSRNGILTFVLSYKC